MSKCVVCDNRIENCDNEIPRGENDHFLIEKFCNYFNLEFSTSSCDNGNCDYFCVDCSSIVVKLVDLREQFISIQTELLKTESIVTSKILTKFCNPSDLPTPNEEQEQEEEQEQQKQQKQQQDENPNQDQLGDLIEKKKKNEQEIRKIRKNICHQFLPDIRLSEVSSKLEARIIKSNSIHSQPEKRKAVEIVENSKPQTAKRTKRIQSQRDESSASSSSSSSSSSEDSDEDSDLNHHDDRNSDGDNDDENNKSEENGENEDDAEKNLKQSQGVVINGVVRWPCDKCQSTFSRRRDMVKHRRDKHQNPREEKQHWKSVLVSSGKFEYGLKKWPYESNEDESKFKCLTCSVVKKTRDEITQHINRVHDKSVKPTCLKCFKSFVSENRLKIHACRPREKLRECKTRRQDDGSWIYNGKWRFTQEPDERDGGHQFLCTSCGTYKKTMEVIKSHCREKHEHANSFLCTECGLTFNAQRFLNRHIEGVHSENFGYLCVDCGKQCKTLSGLYNHRRDRHQEIVYPCSCEQTFKYGSALSKHRRETGHPPAPTNPVTCPGCETTFRSERGFRAHEKKCKGKTKTKGKADQVQTEYECEECTNAGISVSLPSLNSYKKHLAHHIAQKQNGKKDDGDFIPNSTSASISKSGSASTPLTITLDDDENDNENETKRQKVNSENSHISSSSLFCP